MLKNETDEKIIEDETKKNTEKYNKLINSLMSEITKLNNDIFTLELEVEKYPSQIELNQYHRRFLELYNLSILNYYFYFFNILKF